MSTASKHSQQLKLLAQVVSRLHKNGGYATKTDQIQNQEFLFLRTTTPIVVGCN
ncbi:hypothetical protein NMYAN_90051 [Nitrosomonas nitrosa]|uniref:Uncharacterized protein n=1 Tax=Nitrosomonas nitrosa TaxID=52442 RepID=A0A8H8Z221_9PROT|nr:hypothetical protein NMYAN_90051 [Nitrosomonas nitrosa]